MGPAGSAGPRGIRHSDPLELTLYPDQLPVVTSVHNTYVSGGTCHNGGQSVYCIKDGSFVAAIDWAIANDVNVISMSFGCLCAATVFNALSTAYNTYDILQVAAVANDVSEAYLTEPASYSFVIGVGGVDAQGDIVGLTDYRDISAYSFGFTTHTTDSCRLAPGFCVPSGYVQTNGTSAATATAAGIAGLVRAYHKLETAQQIRNRLVATAVGGLKQLHARNAITYVPPVPLSVSIGQPSEVQPNATCSWIASATGGTGTYSAYAWTADYSAVGDGTNFLTYTVGSAEVTLRVTVTDSNGRTAASSKAVSVSSSASPCLDAG